MRMIFTTAFVGIFTASAAMAEEAKVSLSDICPESGCVVELNVDLGILESGGYHFDDWTESVTAFDVNSHPDMMYRIKGVPGAMFSSPEAAADFVTWLYEQGGINVDVLDGDESAPGS